MTLLENIKGLIKSLEDANSNFKDELELGFPFSDRERPKIVNRNIQHNKEVIELLNDCISSADDVVK